MKLKKTPTFDSWLKKLKDPKGKKSILLRLLRIEKSSLLGDVKYIEDGIFEIRIFTGGYRIYYYFEGDQIILLLCAGDKDSQARDIKQALALRSSLEAKENK